MADKNYLFVNNIRFTAITAVICTHSIFFDLAHLHSQFLIVLLQVLKFGSINFFLASGFLLGERIERQAPVTYLRNRLSRIVVPWLFWATLFTLMALGLDLVLGDISLRRVYERALDTLFYSNYWFIPNYFLSLGTLLLLRRFLGRPWFGGLLLLVTLAFSANLYGHWWPSGHTVALFAFVFYLWLGGFVQRHFGQIRGLVRKVPWPALGAAVLLTWALSLAEGRLLNSWHPGEFLNILRLSNQLYSLVIFAALLRLERSLWPGWVNVRQHAFGLFLVHWPIMILAQKAFVALAARSYGVSPEDFSEHMVTYLNTPAEQLMTWEILFAAVYGGAFVLVRILAASPRWSWTIGVGERQRSAAAAFSGD